MSGVLFARTEETADRLALASLLALALHALLLLGGPAGGWALHFPQPSRFDVVLLTPAARPPPTASPASSAAPIPSALAPASPPGAEVSRPAIAPPPSRPAMPTASPPPATAPVPPSAPQSRAPTRAPATAPSVAPPKPPARKPAPDPPAATKPPVAAKTARAAHASTLATAPPKTKPPKAEPNLSADPLPVKPRAATAAKSAPAPSANAPDAAIVGKPPRPGRPPERAARIEENRPSAGAGAGAGGRLNASALLSQVAGLETAKQRRENAGVRAKRVSPNDTQSLEGFYIAAWMRKVEHIGEMNFPDVARKLNLNAGPVLDVSIRADGSLQEVRVARSSGNAELDRAAQRIVRLGAPYAPFSTPLRQRYDVLHIARPWRFEPGGRLRSR